MIVRRVFFLAIVACGVLVVGGTASRAGGGDESSALLAPIIDNDRVAVWDVRLPDTAFDASHHVDGDSVWVSLVARSGEVVFRPKGVEPDHQLPSGRTIVIDLKDRRVPPLENKSGYPNAFPRPGVKKVVDNNRVLVWDYTWTPGQATPTHFHDKDVVVVYMKEGALRSTTPDGQSTMNEFLPGTTKFNVRDRVHTETLVKGSARAIITELR
ncbi:MAG TPA: hypothetical protein VNZ26_17760 [Vicinamibacterales bacterium]|jgi:hypothetical protein|nr:hypothetical protein [Vicinamibacterales bacterium]